MIFAKVVQSVSHTRAKAGKVKNMSNAPSSINQRANLSRSECAQRAADITLTDYRVHLDLSGAIAADARTFATSTEVTLISQSGKTWLDFLGEAVTSVVINGEETTVDWDGARISLTLPAGKEAHVKVEAIARYSRSGEGMHRFVDPADDRVYLYSQYEPADSRRVMAVMEQPDIKASFHFSAVAPASWKMWSNRPTNKVEDGPDGPNGPTRYFEFAPTLKQSSYLTAWVAGEYWEVHDDGAAGELELTLVARQSIADRLEREAEDIFAVTRGGLATFPTAFGMDYPWGQYVQAFVPEYNLGAMENPGCITFTESYLPRAAATHAQRRDRANTILHEMSHMWFGDLATPRWWDDLWLKESFAELMGAWASVAGTRYTDAWVPFAGDRKAWALMADQLPTTHPIMADIPDLEAAKLAFDGITYAKGAAALRQLFEFVGEEQFFAGARLYFQRHAFGATTLDDLLTALREASGKDTDQWAQQWLATTGPSTFLISRVREHLSPSLEFSQVDGEQRPHRFDVAFLTSQGRGKFAVGHIEEIRVPEKMSIQIPATLRGAWDDGKVIVVPDPASVTYAKFRLGPPSRTLALANLGTLADPMMRAVLRLIFWQDARDGRINPERFASAFSRAALLESDAGAIRSLLRYGVSALENFLPEAKQDYARQKFSERVLAGLVSAEHGSDAQKVWARALTQCARWGKVRFNEVAMIAHGAYPGLEDSHDIAWQARQALATNELLNEDELAAFRAADKTADGRIGYLAAYYAIPGSERRAEAWERARNDHDLSNDELDAIIEGAWMPRWSDQARATSENYFELLDQIWSEHSIEMASRVVQGFFPYAPESKGQRELARAQAWLAANASAAPGALVRIIREEADELRRRLECQRLALLSYR